MSKEPANISQLSMQIDINAPVERVWSALTDNIADWWPADFYAGGEEGARVFKLEQRPGGRMFESWDTGGGVLWGTVVCIDPNKRLQVLGATFPNWGGPVEWFGSWDLASSKSGTTLTFSESAIGKVSDAGVEEKDKGWRFLCNHLKAYVEGKPAPAWAE